MITDMILAGGQIAGVGLSVTLLHRARRLSVGLCSTRPSCQSLPTGVDVEQSPPIDQLLTAQER